jgi:hypothetical protein
MRWRPKNVSEIEVSTGFSLVAANRMNRFLLLFRASLVVVLTESSHSFSSAGRKHCASQCPKLRRSCAGLFLCSTADLAAIEPGGSTFDRTDVASVAILGRNEI